MRIKLKKISLVNFKSVHQQDYDFDSSRILVSGGNATGKTTLYEAYFWCLFGKTVMPNGIVQTIDNDNNTVHKIETSVTIVIEVNNEYDVEIKRTLNEKWKASGTSEEKLEGTEVQRYWNGVPIAKTKYLAKLSELVPIDTWQMLSNINTFMGLKMEDRRRYLIECAGGIDENELMKGFPAIMEAVSKRKTIEELMKQATDEKKRSTKELNDIPVKIKAQDALKVATGEESAINETMIDDYFEEEKRLQSQYENTIKKVRNDNDNDVRAKKNAKFDAEDKLSRLKKQIAAEEEENTRRIAKLSDIDVQFNEKKKAWNIENEKSFEFSSSGVCPLCGSTLSEEYMAEEKERAIEEFNINKSNRLNKLLEEAKVLSQQQSVLKGQINQYEEITKPSFERELKEKTDALTSATKSLEAALSNQDIENHPDVVSARKELEDWQSKKPSNADDLMKQKADAEINKRVEAEKERLNRRSIELSQIIADNDSIISQVKAYKKAKIDCIEESVNKMFGMVKWKFYEQNITNDDEKEICTCIVDGKDFVNQNQALRINSMIDIVNGISKAKQLFVPMFIDGVESVTSPMESESQQILLKVVDGQKLNISFH